MTNLLLFLYSVDVLVSLDRFAQFVVLNSVFFLGITLIYPFVENKEFKAVVPVLKRGFTVLTIAALIVTLIPKKNTMYMMAGAVAAGTMLESEAGKKVTYILNKELDKIILEQSK